MPTVLVVDDSPIDRRMVGSILETEPEFEIQYANNGSAALTSIETMAPDLVLTDLIMPELDGLELVKEVRQRHAGIPIILMTSHGSEKIAVEALEQGAASYVPKRQLDDELLDTIRNVLSLSYQHRSHTRLMGLMTRSRASYELPNNSTIVTSLVGHLQDRVARMGICDDAERIRFGVALEEALVNAMYHGNLEVKSELKETDSEAYDSLIQRRRTEDPYSNRRIHVQSDLSREQAVLVVRDEGRGFDPAALPDPTDPENLDRVSGRGILLMRTFMDQVDFNDAGTEVTMRKRRQAVNSKENGASTD